MSTPTIVNITRTGDICLTYTVQDDTRQEPILVAVGDDDTPETLAAEAVEKFQARTRKADLAAAIVRQFAEGAK